MGEKQPAGPFAARATRVRWLVFALACATSWLLYLHRYSWGVVKPFFKVAHPGVSDVRLGWLDSAFNAAYAAAQIPAGLAGDFFGARAVLPLLILLWSLAVAGLAAVQGYWTTFGLLAAFGLAQAGAYPVLNKVTRSWFPLRVRTSVQGMVTALGRIGAACASLIVATLFVGRLQLSWRSALVAIAAPGALLALAVWVVFRNSPRRHPRVNSAELHLIEVDGSPPGSANRPRLLLNAANAWNLGVLLLYAFASTFADMLYVYWIPSFLKEEKGLGDAAMGTFAMLPLLGGAAGGIAGGLLNDLLLRVTGRGRVARGAVAFTGKTLAALLIALSIGVGDGRLAMLVLLAVKFFSDWSLPSQWGAITDVAGPAAATVFALVNTVGAIGGTAAGPVLGTLKEHFGWPGLFFGVAGTYVVAALTWLFIDPTRRLVVEGA